MGLSFRRMLTWLTRQKRKGRHRLWDLLAALHRGSVSCSLGHSEPPISISLCLGHHSTHSHRGWLDLLFLHRMCRRLGCHHKECAQIYFHATIVDRSVTLHVTVGCHLSKVRIPTSRIKRRKWLTSSQGKCTTLHLRIFQRELK